MWVWVTVLMTGIGWYKSINLVLLLAYLMMAMVVINGIQARRNARRIKANRLPILPIYAGEAATLVVAIHNVGRHPVTAVVEDRTATPYLSWFLVRLPSRASTTGTARRVFSQRGSYSGRIRALSSHPFGLVRYERWAPLDTTSAPDKLASVSALAVLPPLGLIDADGLRRWLLQQAGGDGRSRKVLRRATTDPADVRGVRVYRPGDSIRSIHWRSSARRRELMVREYDAAPAPDLILVIEPWLPPQPTPEQRRQLEAALSLAATIVQSWHRVHETKVTLALAGNANPAWTFAPTESAVREALEPLATVVGSEAFAPLAPQSFERPIAVAVRVLVSSRSHSPYADALAKSTGRPFITLSPSDPLPWYHGPY